MTTTAQRPALAARAALAGLQHAHGAGTPCPACGYRGSSALAELELEANPVAPAPPAALMEHFGHCAAQAEGEAEAEAFIGALVPLAARAVPRAAPAIMRAAPQLVRGVSRIGRTLWRDPATRQMVRAVPAIVRDTAVTLSRQVARGRPVTPQSAVRTLARHASRVLGSPQRRRRARRRSQALDRRYHQAACPRTYVYEQPGVPRGTRRPVVRQTVRTAARPPRRVPAGIPARRAFPLYDDFGPAAWGGE